MTEAEFRLARLLPYSLAYSTNLVSEYIARAYRALFNLTIFEWRVICHVAETTGITQQEICIRSRMDKVAVSRVTRALADRGLLRRAPNDGDRRSRRLILSTQGEELYAAVLPKAIELERAIFGKLDSAHVSALRQILTEVDEAVLALEAAEEAGPEK